MVRYIVLLYDGTKWQNRLNSNSAYWCRMSYVKVKLLLIQNQLLTPLWLMGMGDISFHSIPIASSYLVKSTLTHSLSKRKNTNKGHFKVAFQIKLQSLIKKRFSLCIVPALYQNVAAFDVPLLHVTHTRNAWFSVVFYFCLSCSDSAVWRINRLGKEIFFCASYFSLCWSLYSKYNRCNFGNMRYRLRKKWLSFLGPEWVQPFLHLNLYQVEWSCSFFPLTDWLQVPPHLQP